LIPILKVYKTSIYNQTIFVRYIDGFFITVITFGFKVWHMEIIAYEGLSMNGENISVDRNVWIVIRF